MDPAKYKAEREAAITAASAEHLRAIEKDHRDADPAAARVLARARAAAGYDMINAPDFADRHDAAERHRELTRDQSDYLKGVGILTATCSAQPLDMSDAARWRRYRAWRADHDARHGTTVTAAVFP